MQGGCIQGSPSICMGSSRDVLDRKRTGREGRSGGQITHTSKVQEACSQLSQERVQHCTLCSHETCCQTGPCTLNSQDHGGYTHPQTQIHTHMQTYTHPRMQTHTQSNAHAHANFKTNTHTRCHTNTRNVCLSVPCLGPVGNTVWGRGA